jgi:hypothetical protein
MPTPSELNTWFDVLCCSLPETTISDFNNVIEDPPVGYSQYKLPFHLIPRRLKRPGPIGWTYFPTDDKGDRLARMSLTLQHPAGTNHRASTARYVATVKLTQFVETSDTLAWKITGPAIIKIDNITASGSTVMRLHVPSNKRQKVCISYGPPD